MSGPPPSGTPPERNSALDAAVAEIGRLAADRFEILGPLGRDAQEVYAFLARPAGHLQRLVVLKAVAHDPFLPPALEVFERLDASVPPPAGSCPVCQTPIKSWDPSCPDCGTDLAGAPVGSEEALERLRAAVRGAVQGYEVLGDMRRAEGNSVVFFARELPAGQIVALRLDQEDAPGERPRYTVAATRMMRPKMMYGTVGGDASGAEPWVRPPSPTGTYPHGDFGAKVCPQCGDSFEGDIRFCPRDGVALRVGSAEGLIGQVIADRYRILEKLGEGGMGRVYLAEHIHMGRRCAVKVMNPALLHDPDSISRFAREAANASRITHPNVAAIYDYGQTPDRIVYLAMELVEGGSLAELLERENGLQPWRAVHIAEQVADALTAAHELGIVHRDLKPDNIMLARARTGLDQVKVVDFGIAKAQKGGKQTVTRAGFVVGTPAYMSPEQILGDELDGRSDIYSLGCILFEMLTGMRAFAGPSGEVVIRKRLTEHPPPPSSIRRDLGENIDVIVTRAMARSPDQRFASAVELREALQAAAAESGSQTWWRSLLPGKGGAPPGPESLLARATTPPGAGDAAPAQVGADVVPPLSRLGQRSAVLRPHSRRPRSRLVGGLAGGGLLLLLASYGAWRAFGPHEQRLEPPASVADSVTPAPPSTESAAAPTGSAPATASDNASGAPSPGTVGPASPTPKVAGPPDSATLYFGAALPGDARVTVDGSPADVPPDRRLTVSPGRHTVTAKAPGYQTGSVRVAVSAGETRELSLTLSPSSGATAREPEGAGAPPPGVAPGLIVIMGAVPPGAEVRVDGKPLPPGSRLASVAPGPHRVTMSAPGYGSDSTQLEVRSAEQAEWVVADRTPTAQPENPDKAAVSPSAGAPSPATESSTAAPAKGDAGLDAGARALVQAYARAVTARDINQLRALYPAMSADRERQWRDLFRNEVKDLTAATSGIQVLPGGGGADQVEFELTLGFRPDGAKPQTFRVHNRASLRQGSSGWQFERLDEKGE